MNVSPYLIGLLILISLVISDAKHLFMCPSVSFPWRNFGSFFFFVGLYIFLIMSCTSSLYVLEMKSLRVSSFANISLYSECCPCLSLRVSFWYAKSSKVNLVLFSDLCIFSFFYFSKRWIHKELATFMSDCVLFISF